MNSVGQKLKLINPKGDYVCLVHLQNVYIYGAKELKFDTKEVIKFVMVTRINQNKLKILQMK